jgi:hypothetical protein
LTQPSLKSIISPFVGHSSALYRTLDKRQETGFSISEEKSGFSTYGPYHGKGRYPRVGSLGPDIVRQEWLFESINAELVVSQLVKVMREGAMKMERFPPKAQFQNLVSHIVGYRLVRPCAFLVRNPVIAKEARVSNREQQHAAIHKKSRKLGDGDINSGYVHQDHVCQHDVKTTAGKRELSRKVGDSKFQVLPRRVSLGYGNHLFRAIDSGHDSAQSVEPSRMCSIPATGIQNTFSANITQQFANDGLVLNSPWSGVRTIVGGGLIPVSNVTIFFLHVQSPMMRGN